MPQKNCHTLQPFARIALGTSIATLGANVHCFRVSALLFFANIAATPPVIAVYKAPLIAVVGRYAAYSFSPAYFRWKVSLHHQPVRHFLHTGR